MRKIHEKKGITLIALIITIIVLIFLAAVAINLSINENGIFKRIKFAKEHYQNAQDDEIGKVHGLTNIIENIQGISRDNNSEYESKDISDFELEVEYVGPFSVKFKVPEITVNNGKEIKGYAYMLNGEFQKYTTDKEITYINLEKNTEYNLKVYAMDNNWKAKGSKDKKITTNSEVTIADYNQNAISMWLDGIKNTSTGHDSSKRVWYDLIQKKEYSLPSTSVWQDNALQLKSSYISTGIKTQITYTVQFVFSESAVHLGMISNQEYGGFNLSSNSFVVVGIGEVAGDNLTAGKKYVITGTVDNQKAVFWQGNVKKRTINGTQSRNDYGILIGTDPKYDSGYWKGTIYAVRLYDRVLTDDEIKTNYLVDKARFGVE